MFTVCLLHSVDLVKCADMASSDMNMQFSKIFMSTRLIMFEVQMFKMLPLFMQLFKPADCNLSHQINIKHTKKCNAKSTDSMCYISTHLLITFFGAFWKLSCTLKNSRYCELSHIPAQASWCVNTWFICICLYFLLNLLFNNSGRCGDWHRRVEPV